MEKPNSDGWGEFEIIPGFSALKTAAHGVGKFLTVVKDAPLFMSSHYQREHFVENTGAAPMIDQLAFDNEQ